jgi:hypothetical protein
MQPHIAKLSKKERPIGPVDRNEEWSSSYQANRNYAGPHPPGLPRRTGHARSTGAPRPSPEIPQGSAGGPRGHLLVDAPVASDLRCGDDQTPASHPHTTPC